MYSDALLEKYGVTAVYRRVSVYPFQDPKEASTQQYARALGGEGVSCLRLSNFWFVTSRDVPRASWRARQIFFVFFVPDGLSSVHRAPDVYFCLPAKSCTAASI